MCGIVGVLNTNGRVVNSDLIQKMATYLEHRGPDSRGHHVSGVLAFAHTRLKIMDLSDSSKQPMISPDGRFILNYNGEIYNFTELRNELRAEGWNFKSTGDTEVVLAAFAVWGKECITRFNGMFAFAIWDNIKKTLILARDRYGIKPLYISHVNGAVLFASEVKPFLYHPDFTCNMNKVALVEYLTFQNFFSDQTLFAGVNILEPGTFIEIDQNGKEITKELYWDFNFTDDHSINDYADSIDKLDHLLVQAVQRQLVADTEVGSYLSGGLDTGAITAIAAQHQSSMKTFTVGFDLTSAGGLELGFDERQQAEEISYLSGTEQYEIVLKAGDMERAMSDMVWHLEEPRVGQSYPNFYAAKLSSGFTKAVLCGTGGDELLGGYPWRYFVPDSAHSFEEYIDQYYLYWQRLLPNSMLNPMLSPIANDVSNVHTRDIMRNVFKQGNDAASSPEEFVNLAMYFEAKTFLHGLLTVSDKLSMAHGLETRIPFLDNDLVDFASRLPVRFKFKNFQENARIDENNLSVKNSTQNFERNDGKRLLRDMMEKHLPKSITTRPKHGFSGPDESWFKHESLEYVKKSVMGKDACIFSFLNREKLQAAVQQHLDGKENRRLFVWSVLYLEQWCQIFLNGNHPGAD